MILPLIPRRSFDFSSSTNGTFEVPLVRYVDVLGYRSGALLVRVHSLAVSAGRLSVLAYRASPSADAPDIDFAQTTAIAGIAVYLSSPGELESDKFDPAFGSHLRVVLEVQAPATAATIRATISVALLLHEEA